MSFLEAINSTTSIIGGTPAVQRRFGFEAAVLVTNTQICSGSLVAPNVVLTSVGCVSRETFTIDLNVALGCVDINDLRQCEVIAVKDFKQFNEFREDKNLLNADLQLLILETDSVQTPVKLAGPGFQLPPGQDLTTLGWGAITPETRGQDSNGILLEVNLELVSQDSCDAQYRDIIGLKRNDGGYYQSDSDSITADNSNAVPFQDVIINDFNLCAVADGKNACVGDEGGPLFLRCDATKADVQVGVYSFSVGCAFDGIPGVYASILNSVAFKFLKSTVNDEGHELNTIDLFSDFCVAGGTQPPEEFSDPPTPFPTFDIAKWTCRPLFFGDGSCDCGCGIPDPDCEFSNTTDCDDGEICVDAICVDPKNTQAPTFAERLSDGGSNSFSTGGIIGVVAIVGLLVAVGVAVALKRHKKKTGNGVQNLV